MPKKGQKIYNKVPFESPKHQNHTIFETAYLGENAINLLQQKVAQNVTIFGGYFNFSKKHNEPPKKRKKI
jgi:hypothetical protein